MPEKQRVAKARRTEGDLTDLQWDFLHDEVGAQDPRRSQAEHRWSLYGLTTNRKLAEVDARPCADLWRLHGPQVLAWWVEEHPGTRPSCWWRFEGPDGPDAMPSCTPPPADQARKLRRLGVLAPSELEALKMGEPLGRA